MKTAVSTGRLPMTVEAEDECGKIAQDKIGFVVGDRDEQVRAQRDEDNALEAWPEHGLRGTQLGPNKNGKKW